MTLGWVLGALVYVVFALLTAALMHANYVSLKTAIGVSWLWPVLWVVSIVGGLAGAFKEDDL